MFLCEIVNPGLGEIFSLKSNEAIDAKIPFNEETRQMEKNNNSSNSLVFGWRPQTIKKETRTWTAPEAWGCKQSCVRQLFQTLGLLAGNQNGG